MARRLEATATLSPMSLCLCASVPLWRIFRALECFHVHRNGNTSGIITVAVATTMMSSGTPSLAKSPKR